MCGGAVSGKHLPNPIPPRVRRHASSAQIPRTLRRGPSPESVRGSREHARAAPVTQWLLPRTGGLHRIRTGAGSTHGDRPLEHALNPAAAPPGGRQEHNTARETREIRTCPDRARNPTRTPPRTARVTSSAGPRSPVSSSPWCCSGTAPRWPAPPAPPSVSPPSPPSAGTCCAARSAIRHHLTERPMEHPTAHTAEHRTGRRTGHPAERSVEQSVERPVERPVEADVTLGALHRSTDRFPRTGTLLFGQLPDPVQVAPRPPPNPRSTCTERVQGTLRTLRGLATATRRTSLHGP